MSAPEFVHTNIVYARRITGHVVQVRVYFSGGQVNDLLVHRDYVEMANQDRDYVFDVREADLPPVPPNTPDSPSYSDVEVNVTPAPTTSVPSTDNKQEVEKELEVPSDDDDDVWITSTKRFRNESSEDEGDGRIVRPSLKRVKKN